VTAKLDVAQEAPCHTGLMRGNKLRPLEELDTAISMPLDFPVVNRPQMLKIVICVMTVVAALIMRPLKANWLVSRQRWYQANGSVILLISYIVASQTHFGKKVQVKKGGRKTGFDRPNLPGSILLVMVSTVAAMSEVTAMAIASAVPTMTESTSVTSVETTVSIATVSIATVSETTVSETAVTVATVASTPMNASTAPVNTAAMMS